jgi:hypothetical protein
MLDSEQKEMFSIMPLTRQLFGNDSFCAFLQHIKTSPHVISNFDSQFFLKFQNLGKLNCVNHKF